MRAALALACAAALLAACAGGERRAPADAGTFRLTNALHDGAELALVPLADEPPLVRLIESAGATDDAGRWRLIPFGQGIYRVSSVGTGERLSLAVGYRQTPDRIALAPSRKSASQLWYVVPLDDGHCRLNSVLFPDRSLGLAGTDGERREPRLAAAADTPDQRWRLEPLDGAAAAGLPAACGGAPGAS